MNLSQMMMETKQKLVEVLNESRLPIEIIDQVLENVLLTVRNQALQAALNPSEETTEKDNGTK